jgi:hypothetical protein
MRTSGPTAVHQTMDLFLVGHAALLVITIFLRVGEETGLSVWRVHDDRPCPPLFQVTINAVPGACIPTSRRKMPITIRAARSAAGR